MSKEANEPVQDESDEEMIELEHCPLCLSLTPEHVPLDFHTVKARLVIEALTRYGSNHAEAAQALGISRPSLYNWISKYKIRCDKEQTVWYIPGGFNDPALSH